MNIILLILLILLALKSVYPMVLNVINPDINFENVPFSKFIIKYLHGTEFKESISWIAFLILNIYLIYKVFKINSLFKIPLIILLLYLPILFVFPINTINNIYLKLILPHNEPFIDNINEVFPQNKILEENFDVYKNELTNYMKNQESIICVHSKTPGFIIGQTKNLCWRTLQIKTTNQFVDNFENICPELYKILNIDNIHNAFLSILDPYVNIPKHTGYSRIYLRYHLGVDIPKTENKPFIVCGEQKYTWKEGKGVIFDDMYQHYVENSTPYQRVVLYIDLVRPELFNDINTKIILHMLNTNIFVKNYNKNQHNTKSNFN